MSAYTERRKIAATTRELLVARFPKCFMPKGAPKLPLKVDIKNDLLAAIPTLDRNHLAIALGDYCGGATYLRAMVDGAVRVDLDGNPAGMVDVIGARRAAEHLYRLEYPHKVRKALAGLLDLIDAFGETIDGSADAREAMGRIFEAASLARLLVPKRPRDDARDAEAA